MKEITYVGGNPALHETIILMLSCDATVPSPLHPLMISSGGNVLGETCQEIKQKERKRKGKQN